MVKKIVCSPLAIETYEATVSYLLYKFGEAAAKKFVVSVDERLQLITTHPKMFRSSQKRKNTFLTSINNKITLTYRYSQEQGKLSWLFFGACRIPGTSLSNIYRDFIRRFNFSNHIPHFLPNSLTFAPLNRMWRNWQTHQT